MFALSVKQDTLRNETCEKVHQNEDNSIESCHLRTEVICWFMITNSVIHRKQNLQP